MNIQPVAPRNPLLQRYQAQRMPRPQNAAFPQMVQIASDNALAFWIGAVFTFLTFSHSIEFIDISGRDQRKKPQGRVEHRQMEPPGGFLR